MSSCRPKCLECCPTTLLVFVFHEMLGLGHSEVLMSIGPSCLWDAVRPKKLHPAQYCGSRPRMWQSQPAGMRQIALNSEWYSTHSLNQVIGWTRGISNSCIVPSYTCCRHTAQTRDTESMSVAQKAKIAPKSGHGLIPPTHLLPPTQLPTYHA